jgi:hypothetical protein
MNHRIIDANMPLHAASAAPSALAGGCFATTMLLLLYKIHDDTAQRWTVDFLFGEALSNTTRR